MVNHLRLGKKKSEKQSCHHLVGLEKWFSSSSFIFLLLNSIQNLTHTYLGLYQGMIPKYLSVWLRYHNCCTVSNSTFSGPWPASQSRVGKSSTFFIFPQISINFFHIFYILYLLSSSFWPSKWVSRPQGRPLLHHWHFCWCYLVCGQNKGHRSRYQKEAWVHWVTSMDDYINMGLKISLFTILKLILHCTF